MLAAHGEADRRLPQQRRLVPFVHSAMSYCGNFLGAGSARAVSRWTTLRSPSAVGHAPAAAGAHACFYTTAKSRTNSAPRVSSIGLPQSTMSIVALLGIAAAPPRQSQQSPPRPGLLAMLHERADEVVAKYMWAAGCAAAINPFPLLDLAGGSAITVKMVLDLVANVYGQKIHADTIVTLLGQLGKNLIAMVGATAAAPVLAAANRVGAPKQRPASARSPAASCRAWSRRS